MTATVEVGHEARRPTIPEKRHSSTRPRQVIEVAVGELCVTDSHDEAAWVENRVAYMLGYRKARTAADPEWSRQKAAALERQAQTIAKVVIRRL